jgi:hypothetical protein
MDPVGPVPHVWNGDNGFQHIPEILGYPLEFQGIGGKIFSARGMSMVMVDGATSIGLVDNRQGDALRRSALGTSVE